MVINIRILTSKFGNLYNNRKCTCETVVSHQKIELGASNVGSKLRMIMGYALPNVIKISLWDVGVCTIFIRLETVEQ
jgi:uncharacterized membrane protein (Fun14 family)